ncbi:hypothetical protein C6P45_000702 [Maudiozyma exigua]|uniref:Uncharacterized protein n=1 Tax=Maudiozyma exigua TaxID=34358 RepID=A0A9P6W582_MAUEX|nr:hypothetical protein C6P45_000702 [Kazachstania exigua]
MSENVLQSDESVKSEIFQGSSSNYQDTNIDENSQQSETKDQSIDSFSKLDDSVNSSSNSTKGSSRSGSNNNKTINSTNTEQKKDKFNKDGVWSAIDTLDDVRKMAAENKNQDVFPPGFEDDLNTSRTTNATLLHIIRNRSERIAKDIRTSRECYKKEDFTNPSNKMPETSPESGRRSRNRNRKDDKGGPLSRSLSILNLGKKSADFNKSSNSNTNSLESGNDKLKQIGKADKYLSVNLSKHNIFSTGGGSSSEVSDDDSLSDVTDETDTNPRPEIKQERPPSKPLYISDYTDYQANIKKIARDEEEYVSNLIETVRASIPESTRVKQKKAKQKSKPKPTPNPTTKPRSKSRSSQPETHPLRAT